ncbi:regulatory protein RecX [Blautia liquoris]|jgi:regulatory protein|uniref:Regulatory protein RecX n=1 Tax=Blautia liquoris TaxID=2779518 RepID=A0A7M2RKF9_9FIRM|nr:regulatory protein RecX [Blautia liquoris]QOV20057.1 regulatory protein RecX [Blautia liquoris]
MMIQTIKPLTKKKSRVITEGQSDFVLYKSELSRYHIKEGMELSDATYEEIIEKVLKKRAKLRALHLLTAQDRTEHQLREKLKRDGHPDEVIDCAVDYVKSYHYIDDARYAKVYVRSMREKKSARWIRLELERKGVSESYILEALKPYEGESEVSVIENLVQRRAGEPHPIDEKEMRRLYGYLMRRGFNGSEVKKVLQGYREAESYHY